MLPTLVLAPAASGKTEFCIARLRAVQEENPLAPVRVILPDRNQVSAFTRRLAQRGGAFGVEIGTFQDAYQHVLARAGLYVPEASDALTHRLTQTAIESLAEKNQLPHLAPIAGRAGLTTAMSDLIGELKRALIHPDEFAAGVSAPGSAEATARLQDPARIYEEYQRALIALDYADTAGMGWLAVEQLEKNPALAADWRLLIVDGFDSFNVITLKFLKPLSTRVREMLVTLSGDVEMARPVYRRFAETRKQLESVTEFEIKILPRFESYAAPLRRLERELMEPPVAKIEPEGHIEWKEAQTIRVEAREALRWLKARITRDGVSADECAVIARDLAPYRPFLREAAAEFGVPLRFLGDEPLAQNPAVAALVNVLELPLTWKRRALLDVIGSTYFDLTRFGLAREDKTKFAGAARSGQVIEGLDQWREALTRLADAREARGRDEDDPVNQLRGENARALLDALERFAEWVTPPPEATLEAYLDWVRKQFLHTESAEFVQQIRDVHATYARDAFALIELRKTLTSLALAAQATGDTRRFGYAAFMEELRGALAAASYNPDDPQTRRQARIYAGNMNSTRGIPYRAAVILGLSEGVFPAPEKEDPFLSDADRAALRAQGLALEPRLSGIQQTLLYEAVTRAREFLLLTRPYLAPDGETWLASPYWDATRALFNAPPVPRVRTDQAPQLEDAASRAELVQAAAALRGLPDDLSKIRREWEDIHARAEILQARLAREAEGIYEGETGALATILQARYDAAHEMSPSRLERYGTCGYYFFVASALELEPVESPTPGLDAAQLGTLFHQILEKVYRTTRDATDLTALLETLAQVAPPILDAAPGSLGFRPTALWEHERLELLEDLANTLQALDRIRGAYTVAALEKRFGAWSDAPVILSTPAGAVRLRGVIDRVDKNDAGELRVIDYKTGSSGLDRGSFVRGERLQLALYALAAQQLYPEHRVADAFYWLIRGAKVSGFRLSTFRYEDEQGQEFPGPAGAMALAQTHVGHFVSAIRSGTFTPKPPEDGCPHHCPAKNFCWHYSPRL